MRLNLVVWGRDYLVLHGVPNPTTQIQQQTLGANILFVPLLGCVFVSPLVGVGCLCPCFGTSVRHKPQLWLDSKRLVGGFRVLTISEGLYNQLARLGNGDVVEGVRKLLEHYRQIKPRDDQAWTNPANNPQHLVEPQSLKGWFI
jgi:hypothetical protein